jgi:hypothetical protein
LNLFSKEKEIIFKITNAVLLIWLIAAIVFVAANIIELSLKEPNREYTYEEYKLSNCGYKDENLSEEENDNLCLTRYNDYKFSIENSDYYKWRGLYISIANVVIVGGFLYFINRKK